MDAERALMAKVARRDEAAFAELVDRYAGRLLTVARRLLGSRADAEDAVQRTLLQCFVSAEAYEGRWAVSTWLYRILTNTCVDELRRRSVRGAHAASPGRSPAGVLLDDPADAGTRIDVARAFSRVPREARVLLALHYVDGLSNAELARVRGISVNTVKSQLARGKAILRRALDEGGRS